MLILSHFPISLLHKKLRPAVAYLGLALHQDGWLSTKVILLTHFNQNCLFESTFWLNQVLFIGFISSDSVLLFSPFDWRVHTIAPFWCGEVFPSMQTHNICTNCGCLEAVVVFFPSILVVSKQEVSPLWLWRSLIVIHLCRPPGWLNPLVERFTLCSY